MILKKREFWLVVITAIVITFSGAVFYFAPIDTVYALFPWLSVMWVLVFAATVHLVIERAEK